LNQQDDAAKNVVFEVSLDTLPTTSNQINCVVVFVAQKQSINTFVEIGVPSVARGGRRGADLIRTSIYDKYSGPMKITADLDRISHCKISYGTNGRIDGYTEKDSYHKHSPRLNQE